ncbi:MAG: hypothetical protein ACI8T1_003187 [Verrucomicrobiales bacterium]
MKSRPRLHPGYLIVIASLVLTSAVFAEVVINEIMSHPAHVDEREPIDQEFIELWNRGDSAIDLTGWQFDRGIFFVFPTFTLGPNAFTVIAADPSRFEGAELGPWQGRLSNGSETVRLVDRDGETVDSVHYADSGDWAARRQFNVGAQLGWEWIAPFDGEGYSLELVNPDLTNNHGHNWRSSMILGGSPSQINGHYSVKSAPLISEVRHHPAVPTSRERVTVRAEIETQSDAVPMVELHYHLSKITTGDFAKVPMTLDAQGRYTAALPPQPHGSVVEFYVAASLEDQTRTWPASSDDSDAQNANSLYQVDDEVELSDQPYYRLIMPVGEDASFRPEAFRSGSDAQMNATFIASRGGETTIRYQTGLRRRGNGSRGRNPRSFKLNLPADQPWRSVTSFNLVSQYSFLQTLGLHLFRAANLPAPEATLVQLRLNGNNYANESNRFNVHYGSYAHIHPLNGEFIEKAFPEDADGDLYKKVSANPSRDRKRWGVHFEEQIMYTLPNWYITDQWTKETNGAANNWSRFQDFIVTMNEAPAERYLEEVSARVQIDQWLRWFALMNLLNNVETNLSNGIDDDYSMYLGDLDSRTVLLPHDLDTIFGLGDTSSQPNATVFQMLDQRFGSGDARFPQLEAFFNHPDIRPLYFQALHDHMETILAPDSFETFVDSLLSHVPSGERDRIKNFNQQRRDFVRSVIDAPITVSTDLHLFDDVFHTTIRRVNLRGTVSPRLTTQIQINGQEAAYDRGEGIWTADDVPLLIGLNDLQIVALDASGNQVSSTVFSIEVVSTEPEPLPEDLNGDIILTTLQSYYQIEGTLTIPTGSTLTIEPGTTLLFSPDSRILVQGRLTAEGTEALPISLGGINGALWNGIVLEGAHTDSNLAHVILNHVNPTSPALTLIDTALTGHHLNFTAQEGLSILLDHSSIDLADSSFPQQIDNPSIESRGGMLEDFPFTLIRNQLGSVSILERPASDTESVTLEDNRLTTADIGLRLDGDARLVGNRFESLGVGIQLEKGQLLIANHVFHNVGKVIQISGEAIVSLEHSVVDEASQLFVGPDAHNLQAYIANSVFTGLQTTLPESLTENSFVQFTNNFLSPELSISINTRANIRSGGDVVGMDPGYEMADFTLTESSPGKNAGTHGQDLGLVDRNQAYVLGAPMERTSSTSAFLGILGSGWEEAEYRLDDGIWESVSIPSLPDGGSFREGSIRLTGLSDGSHLLELRESEGRPIQAIRWIIGAGISNVRLNELAAINVSEPFDDGFPDWVELYNSGDISINISGYELRGREETAITLTPETVLEPNNYLVVPLSSGFALDRNGETLTLLDSTGTVIDEIAFGRQIENHTLGRLPSDANTWGLCLPSPDSSNVRATVASASSVRFNEWYAAAGGAFQDDFVELVNIAPWPIDLTEVSLTDDLVYNPNRFQFPPHTFLDREDFFVLKRDTLGFGLDPWFETAVLHDPTNGEILDRVVLLGQGSENTTGRLPDGTGPWAPLFLGSPGRANGTISTGAEETALVDWESVWFFHQSGEDPSPQWTEIDFPALGWAFGRGAFFQENSDIAVTKNTPLELNPPHTHAFRHIFNVSDPNAFDSLALSVLVDDGVVVYLNGEEILKRRMPDISPVPFDAFANDGVSNAGIEGPFLIDPAKLRIGTNVLAASVHQDDDSSSDVVFAARLTAFKPDPLASVRTRTQALLTDLRITEIMYHPRESNAEWFELRHLGDTPLDLEGVRFSIGITFTFPSFTMAPGERVVLVSDEAAFRAQYGNELRIAGVFEGRLDNAGEVLAAQLPSPEDQRSLNVRFDPTWLPETNGNGRTLVSRHDARANSGDREDWREGDVIGGTPGMSESPLIYSQNASTIIMGDPLAYKIEALNTPTRYQATNLPLGLTIAETTGVISGAPQEFGEFDIPINVSNAVGISTQLWHLSIASSGPFAQLRWEDLPEIATQDTSFQVKLSARDEAGRLVIAAEGEIGFAASVVNGKGPAVVLTEIRDSGTDGLTLTKLDQETNTAGWRLLLNASADRDIDAVHGIGDVNGRIYSLPNDFTRLDLPETMLGFNLMWTDDPPDERQGGQQGWALIINAMNRVVDFVAWGYSENQLARWAPFDAQGERIVGGLWQGPGVPHPGGLGRTLARTGSVDSDSLQDWAWVNPDAVPVITDPILRRTPLPLALLEGGPFIQGEWQGTILSGSFGSQVVLSATEIHTGFKTEEASLNILPSGPPSLAPTLNVFAVISQPVAIPELSGSLTETLEIDGDSTDIELIEADDRILVQIDKAGTFPVSFTATNAVGSSTILVTFTVQTDADGDGMGDTWEEEFSLDPASAEDAFQDPDQDGLNNLTEFIAGTDPRDSTSFLSLKMIVRVGQDVRIDWSSIPQSIYTVEVGRPDRDSILWETAHPGWIIASNESESFTISMAGLPTPESRLVRVRAWLSGR